MAHVKRNKPAVAFISHGAGPLPLLGDQRHRAMIESLKALAFGMPLPSVILVISAHWREPRATLTGAAHPKLIYDYQGFGEQSLAIDYPAPGAPDVAQSIADSLASQGIDSQLDLVRGFDHGLFVPLKIMYPEADIPCLQLSLLAHQDAGAHMALGRALAGVGCQDLLILGSGASFHNTDAMFCVDDPEGDNMNRAFERWLQETCFDHRLDERQRQHRLRHWEQAPFARYCHPSDEHLLPLHVCYGAAGRSSARIYDFELLGKQASAFKW